jgi:hypothetical protein
MRRDALQIHGGCGCVKVPRPADTVFDERQVQEQDAVPH